VAYENCIAEIVKASGDALSADDAQQALDDADSAIAKRMRQNPLEDRETAASAVARDLATAEKIAAIIEKRQRAINVLAKIKIDETLSRNVGSEQKTINAINVGRTGGGWGVARSVDAQGKSLVAKLVSPYLRALSDKGLLKLFRDHDFEDSVAAEIWRLTEPDNPNLPPLGTAQAQEAARIIAQATEMGRVMQNKAGAWIGRIPGYVMRQDHDMMKIRWAAGRTLADRSPTAVYDWERNFQKWSQDFLRLVDHDKTFDNPGDPKAIRAYLEYVFNALASGKHTAERGADDFLMGFKGPANRAKKASAHRSIHFKGPAEMMEYHRLYGHGTMLESVTHGLERAAKNTALMRTWGTNPEAMFDKTLSDTMEKARDRGDFKATDKLSGSWSKALFKQVNGTANVGGNPTLAMLGQGLRGLNTLKSLGMVLASAVTDVPITASTLRYAGLSYPEAVLHQLQAIGGGALSREDRDELLEQLGVMLEGTTANLGARFTAEDGARGAMSKTLNSFMGMTGIRWWTDNMRAGVAEAASWKMGQLAGQEWDAVPRQLQANLERYGLGTREWDVVRQAELFDKGGRRYLTTDGVERLPDEVLAAYVGDGSTPTKIARAREDIASSLGTYFTDLADEAVNQPGAFERAVTSGGLSTGTVAGEAVRAFMQFKGFGISAARRQFLREFTRGGGIDYPGLALLITGTTAMGWAAIQIKSLLSGKIQHLPQDVEEAKKQTIAAMLQGGGLGIYGDFLFGDTNRYGGGLAETFGGPIMGQVADLYRMKSELQDAATAHDFTRFRADAVRTIKNNLPFQNLLWTKAAMDYLVFYGLQEAANPGYLRRMESRVKDQNQSEYILPPSQYAVRYGG
jgi:hypothetical protein